MGNGAPQVEDGYTQIANELLDALVKIRIPGQARQVLDFIMRKTYGFNKKSDKISLSQFVEGTGLKKATVCKCLKKLKSMKIVVKKGNEYTTNYMINKHYNNWKPLPKKVTLPKKVKSITQKGKRGVPKMVHTKETLTKESIKNTVGDDKNGKTAPAFIKEIWMEKYKIFFYVKYTVSWKKETAIIKSLLNDIGWDELVQCVRAYFTLTDKFIVDSGHSIGVFKMRINKVKKMVKEGSFGWR